jgi:nuclear pore complex protein Nup107
LQNFEKALAQALYAHVRAGKLEEALEVAYKAQQPWRAAAIRGGLLFRWPALGMHDPHLDSIINFARI